MDLDDQLYHYFGTRDLADLSPDALAAGSERMRVDFGLDTHRGRRFALWTLMYMIGVAPDIDVAFDEAADRESARDFMDLADRLDGG